jgi:hypothetical protein
MCAVCAALLAAGCRGLAGDGAKIVEGTDLTLGVQLPYAESDTMAVVNYISGFRVLVAENARANGKYTSATTNDWFGVVTSRTHKSIEADIEPTMEAEEAAAEDATESGGEEPTGKE